MKRTPAGTSTNAPSGIPTSSGPIEEWQPGQARKPVAAEGIEQADPQRDPGRDTPGHQADQGRVPSPHSGHGQWERGRRRSPPAGRRGRSRRAPQSEGRGRRAMPGPRWPASCRGKTEQPGRGTWDAGSGSAAPRAFVRPSAAAAPGIGRRIESRAIVPRIPAPRQPPDTRREAPSSGRPASPPDRREGASARRRAARRERCPARC